MMRALLAVAACVALAACATPNSSTNSLGSVGSRSINPISWARPKWDLIGPRGLHQCLPKDRVSSVADSSIDRASEMLMDVSAVALTREELASLAPGFSPSGPGIPVLLRGIAEGYADGEERKVAGQDQLEVYCIGDAVLVMWLGYRAGDRPLKIAPVIAWLPAVPKDSDVYVQPSYVYHAFRGGDPT